MSRRAPRRRGGAGWLLAYTFHRNAAGFYEAAEAALDRHPEVTRHDLIKALKYARRCGFGGSPAGLPALAALLSPYYKVHAVSAMAPDSIASVCWPEACDTVRDLIAAVSAAIDREASGGESSLMRKEGE
jgi:hypothetical protein